MPAATVAPRDVTLLQQLMHERRMTREQTIDALERRARTMEVRDFSLSVRQLDRWLAGAVSTRPRPSVCRVVEAEFGRRIEELLGQKAEQVSADPRVGWPRQHHGHLRTSRFVEWIADHSSRSFEDICGSIGDLIESVGSVAGHHQAARDHRRAKVGRQAIGQAVGDFYRWPDGMYRIDVDRRPLSLTVLTRPEWVGLNVRLSDGEQLHPVDPHSSTDIEIDDAGVDAAVARLVQVELTDKVLVDQPIYRLLDVTLEPESIDLRFGIADFATYAMTADLLEEELLDATVAGRSQLPLRGRHLPDARSVFDLEARVCVGGPACLFAIARPDGDYVLLVQERSRRVINVAGRLAVIPKAFHQPMADRRAETRILSTIERELEEELLGRIDLDQLSSAAGRMAAPTHILNRSQPMQWLAANPDRYLVAGTAFGFNLVNGNYEVACVVVVDDVDWWAQHGHQVEANWEAHRLQCVSSLDTDGLADLMTDDRWSNEGLFAFVEGLRWLQRHRPARTAAPPLEVTAS